jgi:tripartite-type tricarboxylate transporter receptor subunit TctC
MKRILAAILTMGCVMGALPHAAQADEAFPRKPVKIVLPFAVGGSTDLLARSLADRLGELWNQPVIVENRPGASGTIGATYVARSNPDGYTLLVGTATTQETAPILYPKIGYDAQKDFVAITELVENPQVLVVNAQVPIRSFKEFIAYARANPEKFTHGGGVGSTAHMAMALLESRAGIKTLHVPYKGSGPAMIDVLGGQLMGGFDVVMTSLPHIQDGRLRALAVTTPERLPYLPDVPTIAESGYPGYEASVWFGLFAPARTPPEVVAKLSRDTRKVLQEPQMKERLAAAGFIIVASSPPDFAARIDAERPSLQKIIKDNGMKVE